MSEDPKESFSKGFEKRAEEERKRAEYQQNKLEIESRRAKQELERLKEVDENLKKAANLSFTGTSPTKIKEMQEETARYIDSARNSFNFINQTFRDVVPLFSKNVIVIGAKTGEGKSTCVANVVYNLLLDKNPKTGKTGKALIITNEEKEEDFCNKLTCLHHGWHYSSHTKFTENQKQEFVRMIPIWLNGGRLKIVSDNYEGSTGMTSTLEGIDNIFKTLIKERAEGKGEYDVILIDYYTNINASQQNPYLEEWQVQQKLAHMLDKYKNIYPAAIVIMCQVMPGDKDDKKAFQERIRGSKNIMMPATCVIEMRPEAQNRRTKWIVHKNRNNADAIGKEYYTGYKDGRFVVYDNAFMKEVNAWKEQQSRNSLNQIKGIEDVSQNVSETSGGDSSDPVQGGNSG